MIVIGLLTLALFPPAGPSPRSSPVIVFESDDRNIFRHSVTKSYGEVFSYEEAKALAVIEAELEVLKAAGTYLESITTSDGARISNEVITTIAGAILKTEVITQRKSTQSDGGSTIEVEVRVEVDTSVLDARIAKHLTDSKLYRELEEQKSRTEALLEEVRQLEQRNRELLAMAPSREIHEESQKVRRELSSAVRELWSLREGKQSVALELSEVGMVATAATVVTLQPYTELDSSLMRAITGSDAASVKSSLEDGADLDVEVQGYTPLILAAQRGEETIAEILLDEGARVDQLQRDGESALSIAVRSGNSSMVDLLLRRGASSRIRLEDDTTILMHAAMSGNEEIGRLLIDHGAAIRAKTTEGLTALMVASSNGLTGIAKMLIYGGANVNARTSDGATALTFGATHGSTEILQLLIARGADIHARTSQGGTALHLAALGGNIEAGRLLVEGSADVRARSENGVTPLLLASREGHLEFAEYLFKKGANINEATRLGLSALLAASRAGHLDVVRFLLTLLCQVT